MSCLPTDKTLTWNLNNDVANVRKLTSCLLHDHSKQYIRQKHFYQQKNKYFQNLTETCSLQKETCSDKNL